MQWCDCYSWRGYGYMALTNLTFIIAYFKSLSLWPCAWFWSNTQWMQAVPWRTLSRQASQEFIHNRFVWEKPEMFTVGGVKGRLYEECDTTEECFSVCRARVQRRKHGRVKTHCAPVFPFFQTTSQSSSIVFQNIRGHFDFSATSLPPPHVCTCLLWLSRTLIIFMSATCHKKCVRECYTFFFFPFLVLITQNTNVTVICHFPCAFNTQIWEPSEAYKTSVACSWLMFVFLNWQPLFLSSSYELGSQD